MTVSVNIRLVNPEVVEFVTGFVVSVVENHADIELEGEGKESPANLHFAEGAEDELTAVALGFYFTNQRSIQSLLSEGYGLYDVGTDAAIWAYFRHGRHDDVPRWATMNQTKELSFLRTRATGLPRLTLFTGDRNRMLIEWMEV